MQQQLILLFCVLFALTIMAKALIQQAFQLRYFSSLQLALQTQITDAMALRLKDESARLGIKMK